MIFQGEYFNTIDAKGRASIPVAFRERLKSFCNDEQLVVTKNRERGLTAYPRSAWEQSLKQIQEMPASQKKTDLMRAIVVPAKELGFDAQGRIPLPGPLREFAGLEKDVVVIGLGDKIEIYNRAQYQATIDKSMGTLDEDPDYMAGLGL